MLINNLPPLRAIQAFEAVGRGGSLAAAARELNVTQSAISHQINHLEKLLGLKLFERRGRSLALTAAGLDYYTAAAQALILLRDRTMALTSSQGRSTVNVTTVPSIGLRWLIPQLHDFRKRRANIDVHIRYVIMGQATAADLRILYGDGRWPEYDAERFLEASLIPVCSPEYLRKAGKIVEPCDLRGHLLIHDDNTQFWKQWLQDMGVTDFDPGTELVLQDQHMVIAAVLSGYGVALCREVFVKEDLRRGSLRKLFDHSVDDTSGYYVCARKDIPLTASASVFKRWLISHAREFSTVG
ncbi:LysR substrate-binding domain-containing protein [Albidovulum sp.]|uniref:LysR substrate-binding domain-containing protein n=1 Tax=Albidovulum sp. TaxID=1872424 RepID=UPI0039B8A0CD